MANNFRFYAKADVLVFLQQLPRGERSAFLNEAVKRHRGSRKRRNVAIVKQPPAPVINLRPDIPIGWLSPKGSIWNGEEFVDL